MASLSAIRGLLEQTTIPEELAVEILADTNTLWLLGVPEEQVASELVLLHPPLGPGEVRAVVNETRLPNQWRVTVVTRDRPGLLAGTSGTLAAVGLSIIDVAVTVLSRGHLALQRLTVATPRSNSLSATQWSQLGRDLRLNLSSGHIPDVGFEPNGPVTVEAQPQDLGRCVVSIEAPDRPGLLHTTARWFEEHGCNVDACRAGAERTRARGVFVVTGTVDTSALASALGGVGRGSVVTHVVTTPIHLGLDVLAAGLRFVTTASRAAGAAGRSLASSFFVGPDRTG